jgi:hypothetical protein
MKLPKFKWSELEQLNAIKFIHTMYVWVFLVPILVKLLEHVDEKALITAFGYTFEAQLSLPFSWVAFYFSALAFAIANLVFQIRCPSIIKEQRDYFKFRQSGKGVEHLDYYLFEVDMNWEGLRQRVEKRDEYFYEIAGVFNPTQDDGELRKYFWEVYLQANSWRPNSMLIALLLYAAGSILIAWVLGENAVYVCRYIWNEL